MRALTEDTRAELIRLVTDHGTRALVGMIVDLKAQPVVALTYVDEGYWHPDVKSGQVHLHPASPGRGWSDTMHRQCAPVYTRREARR